MTRGPRIHAVNIHLKQTGFDNFSGRQCCCFAGRLCSRRSRFGPCKHYKVLITYFFDHKHTFGLLHISALHVQNGIQAFAKFKRPECTRLHLRETQSQKFSRKSMHPKLPRKVRRSQSWWALSRPYCHCINTRADKGWAVKRTRPRKRCDLVDWDQIMSCWLQWLL